MHNTYTQIVALKNFKAVIIEQEDIKSSNHKNESVHVQQADYQLPFFVIKQREDIYANVTFYNRCARM